MLAVCFPIVLLTSLLSPSQHCVTKRKSEVCIHSQSEGGNNNQPSLSSVNIFLTEELMFLIKSDLGSLEHKCWNRKIKDLLFPLQAGNGNGGVGSVTDF